MEKIMGVFKYDCFPGMVVNDIIGWDENGGAKIYGGFTVKASALIAVFPKKRGIAIQRSLRLAEQSFDDQMIETKKKLMEDFFEKYPILRIKSK